MHFNCQKWIVNIQIFNRLWTYGKVINKTNKMKRTKAAF